MNRLKCHWLLTVRLQRVQNTNHYAEISPKANRRCSGVKVTKSDGHAEAAGKRSQGGSDFCRSRWAGLAQQAILETTLANSHGRIKSLLAAKQRICR